MMDSCHRQAIARVDANRGTVPALAGCKRVRGVPTAGQISYGIEDVHAWMVARVTLMCQHLGDRIAPTMAWRTGSGEVRGIHVCVEVTIASVEAAHAVGATLIVASVPVFGPDGGPSVAGLLSDVRWAATFARHGLSCIDAPALFADPVCNDVCTSPVVVATTLSHAFPEVPVYAYAGE